VLYFNGEHEVGRPTSVTFDARYSGCLHIQTLLLFYTPVKIAIILSALTVGHRLPITWATHAVTDRSCVTMDTHDCVVSACDHFAYFLFDDIVGHVAFN